MAQANQVTDALVDLHIKAQNAIVANADSINNDNVAYDPVRSVFHKLWQAAEEAELQRSLEV